MLALIGGAVVLVICSLLLPIIIAVNRRRRLLKPLPGLKENFVLGHAGHFINATPPEIYRTLIDGFKKCGKTWKIFLLDDTLVISSEPKVMEVVLSSQKLIKKSDEYGLMKNWLGSGLLLSFGKKWLGRRRAITPTFHFKILEQFVEVFDKNAAIFVDILKKHKPTDAVDIYPLVTLAALDVICETSMGASINAQLNADSDYVLAVKDISYVLHLRMVDVLLRNNLTFPFSKAAQMEKRALKILHQFTNSVIVARRQELLNKNEELVDSKELMDDIGIKKKMALLDVLLQSTIDGKPLTNADIREEVDTFMFEGHDTTTSGVTFALYEIAKHPEVQQRIVKEIHEVIGEDRDAPITLQKLNDLHYLDLVIKETLRMYPSVPMWGRKIEEDITINNTVIPAGTNFILGTVFMHMDPDVFPEPEIFKPERFLQERDTEKFNPYSYVPFSAGPRNCIGQKFAVLEMKSIISKVIRNFEISVDPGYKAPILIIEVILKPENGIMLNFKRRS